MRTAGLIALVCGAMLLPGTADAAWVQWTGVGATNNWYRVVEDTASGWSAARARAQTEFGGDLVTITSAAEQSFVVSTFFAVGSGYGSYWIGATDRAGAVPGASEGTFAWVTGEAFTFAFWGTGQPDNNTSSPFGDGAEGEDFVQFVWRADGLTPHQGRWNDARQAGYSGLGGLPHLELKGFIVERTTDPNPRPEPVPGPGALPLFAVALLGLAAARLRRA